MAKALSHLAWYTSVVFSDLLRLVEQVDVLSLDVFDTALVRAVAQPVDVFSLVAFEHRHRHPTVPEFDFPGARVNAERAARIAVRNNVSEDVTLDEIYAQLDAPDGWPREELRTLECELELLVAQRNPFIQRLALEALARGKRVVFVSDMYLPSSLIAAMLAQAGYPAVELFVSNEARVSKGSGRLFDHVIERLNARRERVLHIGDNHLADVVWPLRRGIPACLYERCSVRAARLEPRSGDEQIALKVRRGLIHGRLHAERGVAFEREYRLGYVHVAALQLALGSGDARLRRFSSSEPLRRGVRDFIEDWQRLNARLPWLSLADAASLLLQEAQLELFVPAERPAEPGPTGARQVAGLPR